MMKVLPSIAASLLLSGIAIAQHAGHAPNEPYAGQERRTIKSLSDEDIAELRRGGGWGLAKAAELNGLPGPLHLLELGDEIALTPEQIDAIEHVFRKMRADAIDEGERLISREQALESAFRDRAMTEETLRTLLAPIEESRRELRYIHLAAHLKTPTILTEKQIDRYNTLRGYGADSCNEVPEGHDPVMWRHHNGCD
jgi:Spy/CpxP family protein refolding chaperone